MTTTVTDAKTLYECSGEMRAFIACWIRDRRCPLPLVDFLLEADLPTQAEAARWAALEPDREVWFGYGDEPANECGPFPVTKRSGIYWCIVDRTLAYANEVHISRFDDGVWPHTAYTDDFKELPEVLLWLLDNWRTT